ncbi:hypothetical protein FF1_007655 [Malus domestica]
MENLQQVGEGGRKSPRYRYDAKEIHTWIQYADISFSGIQIRIKIAFCVKVRVLEEFGDIVVLFSDLRFTG